MCDRRVVGNRNWTNCSYNQHLLLVYREPNVGVHSIIYNFDCSRLRSHVQCRTVDLPRQQSVCQPIEWKIQYSCLKLMPQSKFFFFFFVQNRFWLFVYGFCCDILHDVFFFLRLSLSLSLVIHSFQSSATTRDTYKQTAPELCAVVLDESAVCMLVLLIDDGFQHGNVYCSDRNTPTCIAVGGNCMHESFTQRPTQSAYVCVCCVYLFV